MLKSRFRELYEECRVFQNGFKNWGKTMSRSGYVEANDCDQWDLIRWRGAVKKSIRGERGQKLLRDALAALDAMPKKELFPYVLKDGEDVCLLGAVGVARGVALDTIDPEDHDYVAGVFDIAPALAREIVYLNDDWIGENESPEERWKRMREWVVSQLKTEQP